MTRSAKARRPFFRSHRFAGWLAPLAALLLAGTASAQQKPELLFMRIDGVKGGATTTQPLGADAFAIGLFSVSANPTKPGGEETQVPSGESLGAMQFNLQISGAAVALWQLAAQQKEVPKASFVALDGATGATRLRVDLEQVVVRTLAIQTLGTREATVGELTYQRVRMQYGEKGPTASWDRSKNAPWK